MVHFVGAGPGAPDLITLRGKQLLEEADVIIYAGSLVNPKLLEYSKDICTIYNSANMTLENVISVIQKAEAAGRTTVRLHTGDPQKTESSIGSNDSARVPSTEVLSNQMLEDLEKI